MLQDSHWNEPKATILCWRRCSEVWRLRQFSRVLLPGQEGHDEMKTALTHLFNCEKGFFQRERRERRGAC